MQTIVFSSKHFYLEELAEGVYAAIATPEGLAMGNAGIVSLGNRTIVFDTFLNLEAARELKEQAELLTGNPVSHVINSHFHLDHVVGNQLYGDQVTIFSSAPTRVRLQQELPHTFAKVREKGQEELVMIKKRLAEARDEAERAELQNSLIFMESLVAEELTVRLPDLIFENKLLLLGSRRKAELWTFPVGHTPGDTVLYLPDDGILFAGDLLCIGHHPWLGDGDFDQLIEVFHRLERLNLRSIVPGHGPVGSSEDLRTEIDHIEELKQLVQQAITEGLTAEEISIETLPTQFQQWESQVCFKWNVNVLYQRLFNSML